MDFSIATPGNNKEKKNVRNKKCRKKKCRTVGGKKFLRLHLRVVASGFVLTHTQARRGTRRTFYFQQYFQLFVVLFFLQHVFLIFCFVNGQRKKQKYPRFSLAPAHNWIESRRWPAVRLQEILRRLLKYLRVTLVNDPWWIFKNSEDGFQYKLQSEAWGSIHLNKVPNYNVPQLTPESTSELILFFNESLTAQFFLPSTSTFAGQRKKKEKKNCCLCAKSPSLLWRCDAFVEKMCR